MSDYYDRAMLRRVCAEADRVAAEQADWQAEYEQKLMQRSGPRDDLVYKTHDDALIESPTPVPEVMPEPPRGMDEVLGDLCELLGKETGEFVRSEVQKLSAEIASLRADVTVLQGVVRGKVTELKKADAA